MNVQDALLDRPPEAAVRMLALAQLDDATEAARRLESGTHEEALHDFRVALRRLRTLFKCYRELLLDSVSRKQARGLRALTGGTGDAREAEVQLEWLATQRADLEPGARQAWSWLVKRLKARRRAAYSAVRSDVLQRFTKLEARLRRDLSRYSATVAAGGHPTTFAEVVGDLVRRAGSELVIALEAVRAPTDVEAAHRARLQGKRLRYLVEPLQQTRLLQPAERLVRLLKALQDVLGRLHDMHELTGEIGRALVDEAADRARTLLEALHSTGPFPLDGGLRRGILAIGRRAREDAQAVFQELRAGWGPAQLAAFSGEVGALSAALQGHGGRPTRRRFVLAALPAIPQPPLEITQGWIPGLRVAERLKRVLSGGKERFYVVKNGSERELEEESSRAVFERLWSLTEGRQVAKRSYRVAEGERVWEVDDFFDRDLVIAAAELHCSPDQAVLPDWLRQHVVREVTGEDPYLDENLAR